MKTISQVTSHILAASVAGVALVKLGGAQITANLNGEVILAVAASVAVLGFAAFDYSRRIKSVQIRPTLLRPTLPLGQLGRVKAYGYSSVRRSAIVERAA